jgi:hypothetical protein
VVFVAGDFFRRSPLLLGSIFVVARSFGVDNEVGCILVWVALVFL